MESLNLNFIAIAVAAIVSFVLGAIWYSPVLFAKKWAGYAKVDPGAMKAKGMGKVFLLSFLATLVMSLNLACFIGSKDAAFGTFAGAATGIGWVSMSYAMTDLFEQRPLGLWLINSGFQVLSYTVMGAIIGAWH